MPNQPNTLATGQQIVSLLGSLTNPDTTPLYKLVQLESIKDVTDLVAGGGVCCEVYGDQDTSDRRRFGGVIYDIQSWFILSICSMETPQLAQQIYTVRDLMVVPFQQHAQLAGTPLNVWFSGLKDNMKFFRIQRNGQWLRAHLAELETRQQWNVSGGIIS